MVRDLGNSGASRLELERAIAGCGSSARQLQELGGMTVRAIGAGYADKDDLKTPQAVCPSYPGARRHRTSPGELEALWPGSQASHPDPKSSINFVHIETLAGTRRIATRYTTKRGSFFGFLRLDLSES